MHSWIQTSAGVCGGEPCVRNTRHTVAGLVEWKKQGLTDARLLEHHPDRAPLPGHPGLLHGLRDDEGAVPGVLAPDPEPLLAELLGVVLHELLRLGGRLGRDGEAREEVLVGALEELARALVHHEGCGAVLVEPVRPGDEPDLPRLLEHGGAVGEEPVRDHGVGLEVLDLREDREEILLADCDWNQIRKTRENWPFLRDRRIDAYQDLTSRFLDEVKVG